MSGIDAKLYSIEKVNRDRGSDCSLTISNTLTEVRILTSRGQRRHGVRRIQRNAAEA